jgi:DNA-binding NarL/FixJ family response regulator
MVNVLIIDDNSIFKEGLKIHLRKESEFIVVGEKEDGMDILLKIVETNPDVVIIDIKLKNDNGLSIISKISKKCPDIKIIILTNYFDDFYTSKAIDLGIKAYLDKEKDSEGIVKYIKGVVRGEIFFPEYISKQIERNIKDIVSIEKSILLRSLTPIEYDSLKLIVKHDNMKKVADILNTSLRTAYRIRTNIMGKLNIKHKNEIFSYSAKL